jgi:hypothetical protein
MCLPFTHDYGVPVETRRLDVYDDFGRRDMPSRLYTRLLFVCSRCGKVKVKKIRGHWSAEALGDARI